MSDTPLHHRTARSAVAAAAAIIGTTLAAPADAQRPAIDGTTTLRASAADDIGLVVAHRREVAAQYLVDHWAEIVANGGR